MSTLSNKFFTLEEVQGIGINENLHVFGDTGKNPLVALDGDYLIIVGTVAAAAYAKGAIPLNYWQLEDFPEITSDRGFLISPVTTEEMAETAGNENFTPIVVEYDYRFKVKMNFTVTKGKEAFITVGIDGNQHTGEPNRKTRIIVSGVGN